MTLTVRQIDGGKVNVDVLDSPLTCRVCGNGDFRHRKAQLHTAAMTFLHLDWAQASAEIFSCAACGFLHWFLPDE
jgi:hypothetical protein